MHERLTASWVSHGGIPQVAVVGEIDITTAPQLDAALCEARTEEPSSVIVVLEECTYCDSTGLSVLVRHARKTPNLVVVLPQSSFVRRLLRITGADRAFGIVESVEDAHALLKAPVTAFARPNRP